MAMRFFKKTKEDILNDLLKRLDNKGFSTHEGSICRLFSSIYADIIENVYEYLEKRHINCFVSTADREHLEKIAYSVGLKHSKDVSDNKLRFLVTNHIMLNNSVSKEVVKEVILSEFPDVYDVKFKDFVKGAGSVGIYLHSESKSTELLNEIGARIKRHLPCGVYAFVQYTQEREVVFKIRVTSSVRTLSEEVRIRGQILTNLAKLLKKETFSIQDVMSVIVSSDSSIKEAYVLNSYVNGVEEKITILSSTASDSYTLSSKTEIIF